MIPRDVRVASLPAAHKHMTIKYSWLTDHIVTLHFMRSLTSRSAQRVHDQLRPIRTCMKLLFENIPLFRTILWKCWLSISQNQSITHTRTEWIKKKNKRTRKKQTPLRKRFKCGWGFMLEKWICQRLTSFDHWPIWSHHYWSHLSGLFRMGEEDSTRLKILKQGRINLYQTDENWLKQRGTNWICPVRNADFCFFIARHFKTLQCLPWWIRPKSGVCFSPGNIPCDLTWNSHALSPPLDSFTDWAKAAIWTNVDKTVSCWDHVGQKTKTELSINRNRNRSKPRLLPKQTLKGSSWVLLFYCPQIV